MKLDTNWVQKNFDANADSSFNAFFQQVFFLVDLREHSHLLLNPCYPWLLVCSVLIDIARDKVNALANALATK